MIREFIRLKLITLIVLGTTGSILAQQPATSTPITARVVEDGGTGPYSAIMLTESTLPTHTVFRPKDLNIFKKSINCP